MSISSADPVHHSSEPCFEECDAVHQVLARAGDKWTVAIVAVLGDRRIRFKGLHRAVSGISQRVLTASLRNLERDGLLVRTVHRVVPPRVEYELSDRGRSLRETLTPLQAWVRMHWFAIEEARRSFDAKASRDRAG
jgi:DNA-binding HxlR family transcriptional regulator